MLRHARGPIVLFVSLLAGLLALGARLADAQTIADYSRAQRTMLESAMTQAAARSAGLGASAAAVAASTTSAAPAPVLHTPLPAIVPVAPAVQVSGVFASRDGALAEVVVNATPYLLGPGQGVPGTPWHVEAIAVDRVVLGRQVGADAVGGQGVRKVFALPALR